MVTDVFLCLYNYDIKSFGNYRCCILFDLVYFALLGPYFWVIWSLDVFLWIYSLVWRWFLDFCWAFDFLDLVFLQRLFRFLLFFLLIFFVILVISLLDLVLGLFNLLWRLVCLFCLILFYLDLSLLLLWFLFLVCFLHGIFLSYLMRLLFRFLFGLLF